MSLRTNIRNSPANPAADPADASQVHFFSMLPKFARDLLVWRRLQRDPFFMKRMMGTVSVTSIGMACHCGISPRPLLVDHDVTDGAPSPASSAACNNYW